jgi:cytochrome c oxidase cbb3-type subunit I/II
MATSNEERLSGSQTIAPLIRWHGYAAVASVLYVALLGLAMSIKFHAPDWLGSVPWLSWGRIRYAHTQGLFFGWLGNAFLAFLYYAVPRLADRPVTSVRLGWALFAAWNGLVVLPGWALVQAGVSQPLEWAEFPLPVDGAATLGMLLASTCPAPRGRRSAASGFTTPSASSSLHWHWPSPTPSSQPCPGGRSIATSCR